jgi:hypothetical protein
MKMIHGAARFAALNEYMNECINNKWFLIRRTRDRRGGKWG